MDEGTAPAWAVRTAAVGLAAEGLGALLTALSTAVAIAVGRAGQVPLAAGLAVTLVGLATLLGLAARSVARGRLGVRGVSLTWQLLQGATSLTVLSAVTARTPAVVPVLAGVGLAVALVVSVALVRTLSRPRPAPGAPARR